jgi:NTP pyrophosphatase (non-canonical NTP hydrolase)
MSEKQGLFNKDQIERGYKITERYEKLWGRWHVDSQMMHIITEVSETRDVIRNKDSKYGVTHSQEWKDKLGDEVADIFLTTVALAGYLGISADELNDYIAKKLTKVEKRVEDLERKIAGDANALVNKVIPP